MATQIICEHTIEMQFLIHRTCLGILKMYLLMIDL